MERWKKILIHAICWGILSSIIWPDFIRWQAAGDWTRMLDQAIYLTTLVTCFYYCYAFAWPRFNMPGKSWQLLLLIPLTFFAFWLLLAGPEAVFGIDPGSFT